MASTDNVSSQVVAKGVALEHTIEHRPVEDAAVWRVRSGERTTYFADCPEGNEALLTFLREAQAPFPDETPDEAYERMNVKLSNGQRILGPPAPPVVLNRPREVGGSEPWSHGARRT